MPTPPLNFGVFYAPFHPVGQDATDDPIAYIDGLLERSGGFGTFLLLGHDRATPVRTINCYRLLGQKVIPHFEGRLHAGSASHDCATARRDELFGRAGRVVLNAIHAHVEESEKAS